MFWRLFTLLYTHRNDVVDYDQLHSELHRDEEMPTSANVIRENVRRLRKVLAGSRYEIINHPTIGYELIVAAPDPEDQAQLPKRSCNF
jgi:DNA-binding response OmpR family regulator